MGSPAFTLRGIGVRAWVFILLMAMPAPASSAAAQSTAPEVATLAIEGATALQERRFADAFAAFSRATTLQPRDASLWFGGGVAAYMLGRNAEAERQLERALQLQPKLQDASWVLGELQYASGKLREAIATYEAALQHAPAETRFSEQIARWSAEERVQSRFYESRGAHFRVLFEGPADQALSRRVVEILEAAYWRIGGALSAYPDHPTEVVLYTQQQFKDITRAPMWVAGAYDGRIRVPMGGALEHIDDLERVLSHEYVHALVASLGGRSVPAWLNEGLAVMFEPNGLEDATRVLARATGRPPIAELHDGFGGLPAAQAGLAYAQSAVAVRAMLDLRGAPAVVTLLRDIATGTPFATAFHQRMAMRYTEFQAFIARR